MIILFHIYVKRIQKSVNRSVIIGEMKAREVTVFVCKNCGNESAKWMGRCPGCGEWNSLVEAETVTRARGGGRSKNSKKGPVKSVELGKAGSKAQRRIPTGIRELDLVLGGGVVTGQVILVAGEPGIGKSTLLLQTAARFNAYGFKTAYVCGEESVEQVGARAKRLGLKKADGVVLLSETDADQIVSFVSQQLQIDIESSNKDGLKDNAIGVMIVDSIQTLTTGDIPAMAGSVSQVRECALRLVNVAKETGAVIFVVGHVTKDGDIAGPRVMEHMVDTVLWFEGERSQPLRLVRTVKNRFGPTDEVGVFRMSEEGLIEVANPGEFLLEERVKGVAGSVVSVVMEGTRPMLVEVQALTVPTQLPMPRRVASGIDFNRLQMLTAVLTRRAGLDLGGSDVFVNVVGGVKINDPGLDLAVCLAIASAYKNKPVSGDVAAVGEVGLMGEVRKVGGLDKRVREAKKLGYKVASAESGKMVGGAISKLLLS